MLRVLVVDDEPRQRKILSKIIRDYCKEFEVVEAKNGEEALGLCKERKMDIVFSDIRMPKMDGLSLFERICEQNPGTRLVVVSGYSDFAYAQKALDLRVFRYILKPIEGKMIGDLILQIEEDIRKDRISQLEKAAMAEHLNMMRPFYCDHLLNKWLKGDCTHAELEEIRGLLQTRGYGCAILSCIGHSGMAGHPEVVYTAEEWNEIKWNFRMWMNETLNPYGHVVSFFLHQDTNTLASLVISESEPEFRSSRLRNSLQGLADNLLREYGISVKVGVGQVQRDLYSTVQAGYRTAEAALHCLFYLDDANVVYYSDIESRYSGEIQGNFSFEDKLKPFVYGQVPVNRAEMAQLIEQGLACLLGSRYPEPELLLDDVRRHLFQLLRDIQNIVPGEAIGEMVQTINKQFQPAYCSSLAQLKKLWLDMIEHMAAAVQTQKDNKNNIVMERCLHYIHSHVGEEFSLEDLAHKYFYNASYFSTLFKKYTGKHFTDYITQLRVETAYKNLLETDKKIYEIAQEVGYRDVKYFNKIFKKHYGMTPEECRVFGRRRE
jgi:two-component system response regulator YesN